MSTLSEDLALITKLSKTYGNYPLPEFTEEEAGIWLPDIMHKGDYLYSTEKKHHFIFELTITALTAFAGQRFCMVEGEYALLEDDVDEDGKPVTRVVKIMNYTRLVNALKRLAIELADDELVESSVDSLLEAWYSFGTIYGLHGKYDSETFNWSLS